MVWVSKGDEEGRELTFWAYVMEWRTEPNLEQLLGQRFPAGFFLQLWNGVLQENYYALAQGLSYRREEASLGAFSDLILMESIPFIPLEWGGDMDFENRCVG
ncbi:hypothetical protein PIB30_096939 [Stylosanthes scabra]|uniref:Uncharacterized protein n=1 Tax=Stylosanthes scabra TaxID=79078 RepID=A0ABU6SWH4_9FABA|nr:hypothetical protein [Stylosanthes scabra]